MTQKTKTYLGFDYGLRWIGCASGQNLTQTAQTLPALSARDGIPDWLQIEQLLAEWKVDGAVIGLPLNMDGSESSMSTRARKFANRLHGRFGIAVFLADERLSSYEARGDIIADTGSRQFKKENVDSRSAAIILESWLREQAC